MIRIFDSVAYPTFYPWQSHEINGVFCGIYLKLGKEKRKAQSSEITSAALKKREQKSNQLSC